VVEIGSSTGNAGVAALKEGQNAVWVSTESDDKQETFKMERTNSTISNPLCHNLSFIVQILMHFSTIARLNVNWFI